MNVKTRIARRVAEIPFKKGSAGWLRKFVSIMWQNGIWGIKEYNLTPEQIFKLKYISTRSSAKDKRVAFNPDKWLVSFFKKYGFRIRQERPADIYHPNGMFFVDFSRCTE